MKRGKKKSKPSRKKNPSRIKPIKNISKSPKIKSDSKASSSVPRISTGIPNFDHLIEGGFEKRSINLIIGGSGSSKTIFATQFVYDGLLKGETCLFVTFEEKKQEFFMNMKEFGWDLEAYEKQEKFMFLEYTPEKVKTMLEEGGGIIESIILEKKINRVVIDSITSFALLFDTELERREASLALFGMLRKWDCTTVLTYQRDPLTDKRVSSRVIEFESDSIVMLYFPRIGKERERLLEIVKMRGTRHSTEIYPFMLTKSGIYVHPKSSKIHINWAS